jgi:hypothetical protein
MTENPFLGSWRIVEMAEWDQEFLDLEVPAFVEFREDHVGAFQFGTVSGFLDCRLAQRDGKLAVEWSWEGNSDSDPACGRGWARIKDGELVGHIFIHLSDDSTFRAVRDDPVSPRSSKRGHLRRNGAA